MNARQAEIDDDVSSDDVEVQIEVVDDTPEEDRGRSPAKKREKVPLPDEGDEELSSYSDKVQTRIKRLRHEFHEERREKERVAREHQEALRFAQTQMQEAARLRQELAQREEALVGQAKARTDTQLDTARREYKDAYEAGDTDKLLAAQEKLNKLTLEADKISSYVPRRPQQEVQVPVQQPAAPQLDERTQRWVKENDWFNRDEEMTGYALGLHEKLVRSGIRPGSDEYYGQVDTAMRRRFPENFDGDADEQPRGRQAASTVVAAPSRQPGKSPRKVVLTASQVSVAKRLGLTPEQYAAQLIKEMGT